MPFAEGKRRTFGHIQLGLKRDDETVPTNTTTNRHTINQTMNLSINQIVKMLCQETEENLVEFFLNETRMKS